MDLESDHEDSASQTNEGKLTFYSKQATAALKASVSFISLIQSFFYQSDTKFLVSSDTKFLLSV